jgi:hypothetical protein
MLRTWADFALVVGVLLLAPLSTTGHVITAANASKVLLRQEVRIKDFGGLNGRAS